MRRALLVLVALMGALIAYGVWRGVRGEELEWFGTVEARTVEVGSRIGGRVQEVLAREGDVVAADQPLLTLEPGDLGAQRRQAEGQLQQAQAALDHLVNRRGAIGGARWREIAVARARLASAQAMYEKARNDDERARVEVAADAIPRAEADAAHANLLSARAQRDAQRELVAQLLVGSPSDIEATRGQIETARARVEAVDVALGELTVRAARPSRIETLDLRPGDLLAPLYAAAVLVEEDQLYVRIYVPETQLGHVRLAEEVAVYVDTFPGRAFRGRIAHINSVGEYSPRNLQVADERANQLFACRVELLDTDVPLRAGMSASIRLRPVRR